MNEIAKALWDLSLKWVNEADNAEDTDTTLALVGQAQTALQMAQFAVNNPSLVAGQDGVPVPDANTPVPVGPTSGRNFGGHRHD